MPAKKYLITEKVKASYTAIAHEFDRTRQQSWPEFEHFLDYVKEGAKVLDVGCGNGRLFEKLREKKVVYLGVDHNESLLKKAKENFPEADFQLMDMVSLHLKKNYYNNLFCIAAFHHLPTKTLRKKVLADFHRSLKKDGVLILTTWNLFQRRYLGSLLKSIFRSIFTLGTTGVWNDFWIKWGNYPLKRYYHCFLPSELYSFFDKKKWQIEEFYFTKKGNRVSFWGSFNLVVIAKKIKD